VSDTVLRLQTFALLCGFVRATQHNGSRALFTGNGLNLSSALSWYNDSVQIYESLLPFSDISNDYAVDSKMTTENCCNILSSSFLQRAAGLFSELFEDVSIDELKKVDDAIVDASDLNLRVEIHRRFNRSGK